MSRNKINFALRGSLRDAQRQRIPNYNCPSVRMLEAEVNGSVQLTTVGAYEPAIYDDGSFLLEPPGVNLMTWNMDLGKNVWLKGSNVFVQSDRGVAPDNSYLADSVTWINGQGATQRLQRQFSLDAAETYQLTLILQATGGRCGSADVIRVSGGVVGNPSLPLSQLNEQLGKYRILTLPFTTTGVKPVLPASETQLGFIVTAVTANTVTVTGVTNSGVNALVGGVARFGSVASYEITASTAVVSGSIVVTVATNNLIANGVTTANRATFEGAPERICTVEIYCESTFSLLWGCGDLKRGAFRTSPIYQLGETVVRGGATMAFQNRDNPLVDLINFGVFGELRSWRGDGNLIDFGDLKLSVVNNKLRVTAGSTQLEDSDPLPENSRFFVGVSSESSSISLFVNGLLKRRSNLSNFRPASNPVILTTPGLRAWKMIVTYGQVLLDGKPEIGEAPSQEVARLFSPTEPVVGADLISAPPASFNLPLITVPRVPLPSIAQQILAVYAVPSLVTIASTTGLIANDSLIVVRGRVGSPEQIIVSRPLLISPSEEIYATLDSVAGIRVGDFLVKGNALDSGHAFIRFPFVPIDERLITEVDVPGRRVRVGSSLSFIPNLKAIVRTPIYQDVTEVMITLIDNTNGWLTVDDVNQMAVGQLISQIRSETLIDPELYTISFLSTANGVRVGRKAQNGISILNENTENVVLSARVEVHL